MKKIYQFVFLFLSIALALYAACVLFNASVDWLKALILIWCSAFIFVIYKIVQYDEAYSSAFSVHIIKIHVEPFGDDCLKRIFLEIENQGDGAICITSAGFIMKGGFFFRKFIFSEFVSPIPLRLERMQRARLVFEVDKNTFKGILFGLFFDIDAKSSDQPNKASKILANSKFGILAQPFSCGLVRTAEIVPALHEAVFHNDEALKYWDKEQRIVNLQITLLCMFFAGFILYRILA